MDPSWVAKSLQKSLTYQLGRQKAAKRTPEASGRPSWTPWVTILEPPGRFWAPRVTVFDTPGLYFSTPLEDDSASRLFMLPSPWTPVYLPGCLPLLPTRVAASLGRRVAALALTIICSARGSRLTRAVFTTVEAAAPRTPLRSLARFPEGAPPHRTPSQMQPSSGELAIFFRSDGGAEPPRELAPATAGGSGGRQPPRNTALVSQNLFPQQFEGGLCHTFAWVSGFHEVPLKLTRTHQDHFFKRPL